MLNSNRKPGAEITQLTVSFRGKPPDYRKDRTVVTLFEEQALNTPEAVAIIFEDKVMSYAELNRRSNQLAHYLKHQGVKADALVPICVRPGLDMIIGIFGILKAGGAYAPIDPDSPLDRIAYVLEDAKAMLMVCSGFGSEVNALRTRVIDLKRDSASINKRPHGSCGVNISAKQLAYVIYTSGSTGKPKGVMIEHKSLLYYLSNSKAKYTNGGAGNAGSFAHLSYTFDASIISLFTPLLGGKYLVIGSKNRLEIFADENFEKYAPYDFITITPSHIGLLPTNLSIDDGWIIRKLVIGGEKLRLSHFDCLAHKNINVEIINEYGPTEATVGCCSYSFYYPEDLKLLPDDVPIGKPISDTMIYILNGSGKRCIAGESGEIFVGGEGLARGYLNNIDLTAERFVKDPFSSDSNARLYKTGDLGRWTSDCNIEYLGRTDDQVKIRGYRVEPGEVESALNMSGLVKDCIVLAKDDGSGNKQLVGYIIAAEPFDKQVVQKYLSSKLPDYMIPTFWVEVERFQLNQNGKVDRKALLELKLPDVTTRYTTPQNPTEAVFAKIWSEFLGIEHVGIHHNFFELGGNSLLAIRIISSIRKNLNVELNVRDFFVYPTIAALIDYLGSQNKKTSKLLIPIRASGGKIPLYIICGAGGTVFQFINFVEMLDIEQPVYVLQQPIDGNDLAEFPKTIEGIADAYIMEILKQNPNGPYALSGHCLGAIIAFEMALQLKNKDKEVSMLIMFDPYATDEKQMVHATFNNHYGIIEKFFKKISLKMGFEMFLLLKHPKQDLQYRIKKVKALMGINKTKAGDIELESFNKVSKVFQTATANYKMKHYDGELILFYAKDHYYFVDRNKGILYKRFDTSSDTKNSWKKHAKSVVIHEIEGEHSTMFDLKYAPALVEILQNYLKSPAMW
jgi:amino acid adenylation domain-containing protein